MKTQEYYSSTVLDDLWEYIKEDKNIDFPSYRLLRNKIFLARLKIKGELMQAYSQGKNYGEKIAKWENKRQEKLSDKLHDRIHNRISAELQRQKDNGMEFISDEEIDKLIDEILKNEIN